MRILMLTASLPYPPHQGGALRSLGILHGLAGAGHDVTLLSFHDRAAGLMAADSPLRQYCTRIETVEPPQRSTMHRLKGLILSGQPDIAQRLHSEAFHDHVRSLMQETPFDLVQFEGIEVACYLPLLRRDGARAKLCYDAFNAEASLQRVIFEVDRGNVQRWPAAAYSLIQSARIRQFEQTLCQQADAVIAVSAEDAAILRRYRADGKVAVVTNGIFSSEYSETSEQLNLGPHALVFTGKMDYRPNVDAMHWFAESVLPLVRARIPDVKLYIVGQQPHPRLQTLRNQEHIEITGWVRDVRPFLHGASVYVAPLRMGSGTRLKILEAMAAGCCVVATTTAISGMQPDPRRVVATAEQPAEMAEAIVTLLQNVGRRRELSAAAQTYVRRYFDWSALIPDLLAVYGDMGLG